MGNYIYSSLELQPVQLKLAVDSPRSLDSSCATRVSRANSRFFVMVEKCAEMAPHRGALLNRLRGDSTVSKQHATGDDASYQHQEHSRSTAAQKLLQEASPRSARLHPNPRRKHRSHAPPNEPTTTQICTRHSRHQQRGRCKHQQQVLLSLWTLLILSQIAKSNTNTPRRGTSAATLPPSQI